MIQWLEPCALVYSPCASQLFHFLPHIHSDYGIIIGVTGSAGTADLWDGINQLLASFRARYKIFEEVAQFITYVVKLPPVHTIGKLDKSLTECSRWVRWLNSGFNAQHHIPVWYTYRLGTSRTRWRYLPYVDTSQYNSWYCSGETRLRSVFAGKKSWSLNTKPGTTVYSLSQMDATEAFDLTLGFTSLIKRPSLPPFPSSSGRRKLALYFPPSTSHYTFSPARIFLPTTKDSTRAFLPGDISSTCIMT